MEATTITTELLDELDAYINNLPKINHDASQDKKAWTERDGEYFKVVHADGRTIVRGETMTVCDNIAHAINNPSQWVPGEAYEIADGVG